jgi:histidine kinase/DNA gyrase B/HSP90-like ATPase
MPFEPMTIEHLGLRLYSTLPPVITELVTNAFDAESKKAEVIVPAEMITPKSEVIIRDFGHGMKAGELQNHYLPIGRNRRGEKSEHVLSKNGKVRVTGRKGLGKLSGFGVADVMEIRSVSSGEAITLRLSYPKMREWGKEHPGRDYEPEVVADRSGSTTDPFRGVGLHQLHDLRHGHVRLQPQQQVHVIRRAADRQQHPFAAAEDALQVGIELVAQRFLDEPLAVLGAEDDVEPELGERVGHGKSSSRVGERG